MPPSLTPPRCAPDTSPHRIGSFRLEDESNCPGRNAFRGGTYGCFGETRRRGDWRGWHGKNRGPKDGGRRYAVRWRGKPAATAGTPWRALANIGGCGHRPRRRHPGPGVTHFPTSTIGSFSRTMSLFWRTAWGHKLAAGAAHSQEWLCHGHRPREAITSVRGTSRPLVMFSKK